MPQENRKLDLYHLAEMATPGTSQLNDIYVAVTALFEGQAAQFSGRERALACDILRRLSKDVEMSIRIAMAERLADDPDAPHDLILLLADDRIEVARPVLARSPVLSDSDLLHVIEIGSHDHHVAVAERPAIGESVSAALARSRCEAAIITLLRNRSANIGADTFQHLVERAQTSTALQLPLVQRDDLPPPLAGHLYTWVSGALKTALAGRYPYLASTLARTVEEAAAAAQTGMPKTSEDAAIKLIAKLAHSGQLRPSFLIRVLHQGQMDLFEHGFAALLEIDVEQVRRVLYGARPALLALACRAAGIDRSVFTTVFNLSHRYRHHPRILTEGDLKEVQDVFGRLGKGEALEKIRQMDA